LILSYGETGETKTYANTIALTAKDVIEDDTIVEFFYSGTLADNVTYSVYKVVYQNVYTKAIGASERADGGIIDYAGNQVFVADVMSADLDFDGTSEEHEKVELDSYSQIDAKTFELVFARKVVLANGDGTDVGSGFKAYYESAGVTSDDKIRFVKQSNTIVEDTEYKFDFINKIADKLGFDVANDEDDDTPGAVVHETILTGEYDDEDAPYVDDVVARDREWIKVVFNERIDESGLATDTFSLRNNDLDKPISITAVKKDTLDDGIIYLKAAKPLEARYEYELTLDKDHFVDFAGLKAEKETYYFYGTNIPTYGTLEN